MKWFWEFYMPDHAPPSDITASPLLASTHERSGLAPALVITAEHDVLRDQGEAYERLLIAAGRRAHKANEISRRYSRLYDAERLSGCPACKMALQQTIDELASRF